MHKHHYLEERARYGKAWDTARSLHSTITFDEPDFSPPDLSLMARLNGSRLTEADLWHIPNRDVSIKWKGSVHFHLYGLQTVFDLHSFDEIWSQLRLHNFLVFGTDLSGNPVCRGDSKRRDALYILDHDEMDRWGQTPELPEECLFRFPFGIMEFPAAYCNALVSAEFPGYLFELCSLSSEPKTNEAITPIIQER